jgi:hypothetical protein
VVNDIIYICIILKKLDVFNNKNIHVFRNNVLEGVIRWKTNLFKSINNNEKLRSTIGTPKIPTSKR